MALSLGLVSGGDGDEEEEEADPSASEKKVCMEKLLGWVKSIETESPDTLIHLKQVRATTVELPVQKSRSSLTSMKVLTMPMKKT